jgi:hypothetical protein
MHLNTNPHNGQQFANMLVEFQVNSGSDCLNSASTNNNYLQESIGQLHC